SNVAVTVDAPSGVRRVVLEGCERAGQTWAPRAVARLEAGQTRIQFRLPAARAMELLRVRADIVDPLPASFYSGSTSFVNQAVAGRGGYSVFTPGIDATVNTTTPPETTPGRAVVESDIWKLDGDTLYFFNQYRGLQVIDVSNPDMPALRGTLELPAAGDQMYLLDGGYAVLLVREGCGWSPSGPQSQMLVVDVRATTPRVVATLPISGAIQESRLVGRALYIAAQAYRPVATTNTYPTWEGGTVVSGIDLTDPAAPVVRNTLWTPGYGQAVTATDVFLFIMSQTTDNPWATDIRCLDITAPDGTLNDFATVRTAGRVADKFKVHWSDSVLTVISQTAAQNNLLSTRLETFRLPHPAAAGPLGVVKLGELNLATGERLFATRFDGTRAYLVTFGQVIQIDPFWIIDLSDPTRPRITGELEVPGFSTFLQPLGDRVVAVGVETNRVSVSLFDVAEATRPRLLSRVLLGQGFSWSEANFDEKAFNVMPEAGLILLPFASSSSNGLVQAVQLVDLGRDSLRARGRIDHSFWPRRATLIRDRILSLSGWQLLSVDATDRDQPVVRAELQLAWPVHRVFLAGEHLLELSTGSSWGADATPTLRVATVNDPNRSVMEMTLPDLPVLGATVHESRLYVVQGNQRWYRATPSAEDGSAPPPGTPVTLSVLALDGLPELTLVGRTTASIPVAGLPGNLEALWPKPGLLVWAGSMGGPSWWWRGGPIPMVLVADVWWPYYWSGNEALLAFEVAQPEAPALASFVHLAPTNGSSFSRAFTAEGRVYLSHHESEFWPEPFPILFDATGHVALGPKMVTGFPTYPYGRWIERAFLNVIDYANPREPLRREPVNIPGRLEGISRAGALLYTVGTRAATDESVSGGTYLDASAYDGVNAHLVDSLPLEAWPHPVLVRDETVFLGRSAMTDTNPPGHRLETWTLPDTGRFAPLGSLALAYPLQTLAPFPGLLAGQDTQGNILLIEASVPAAPALISRGRPAGCVGYQLEGADGDRSRGLFLPLDVFGVGRVPVP
ncbi:MAG TPA: beta-propeller domain-containing protein, partial [Methylomirabilota bacterium]|nr:beta-propeller domain-containing protein [Methylomirabilota bacterium]